MEDQNELPPVEQNQRPLQNQDLGAVSAAAGELLSLYGWYVLAAAALLFLLIQYIVKKNRSEGSTRSSATPTHQDASLVAQRQEALEAARMRMQEELDAKAALFKEKQKQEEDKRRQKIENWDSMVQGKSSKGNASQSTEDELATTVIKRKADKKPLRGADYNPLAGDGGGACAWRPGRRGPSSGG